MAVAVNWMQREAKAVKHFAVDNDIGQDRWNKPLPLRKAAFGEEHRTEMKWREWDGDCLSM